MFNSPRPASSQRYNGLGAASFVAENPLLRSVYQEVEEADPWSSASTPALTPPSPALSATSGGVLGNIIGDANVPNIYNEAFSAVDPSGLGEVSVNALIRVITTGNPPARTIDRIVNLVSSRSKVSRFEFYVALGLLALAQSGEDISIEQISALAQSNRLPSPTLDLSALLLSPSGGLNGASSAFPSSSTAEPHPPFRAPSYSESDPWSTRIAPPVVPATIPEYTARTPLPTNAHNVSTSLTGGLGQNWWKNQARIEVSTLPEKQGFILSRYTVYQIVSDRGPPVLRRYSEFTYLYDCLVRRYPFRILPNLPPKRLGADGSFLEQRRKGLQRFLRFIVNHPIIKEDGLLSVFLTEPNLEAWRKHSNISLEEESASKRIDRAEEMNIPSDLDDKAAIVRKRVAALIEQWSRLCIISERILKRCEAAAADMSRLTMTLNAVIEENPTSWRSEDDEFYAGIRQGLQATSKRIHMQADQLEDRTHLTLNTSLEALKLQRDLYIATRDLFLRYDRLSSDPVDKLKKRVETNGQKLEAIKAARKEGWAAEADKVLGSIELDQSAIGNYMARRVHIRHSLWHELRVVLYNRENTLITEALRIFTGGERIAAQAVLSNWTALEEELASMPLQ